jgi:hypothetical protein
VERKFYEFIEMQVSVSDAEIYINRKLNKRQRCLRESFSKKGRHNVEIMPPEKGTY